MMVLTWWSECLRCGTSCGGGSRLLSWPWNHISWVIAILACNRWLQAWVGPIEEVVTRDSNNNRVCIVGDGSILVLVNLANVPFACCCFHALSWQGNYHVPAHEWHDLYVSTYICMYVYICNRPRWSGILISSVVGLAARWTCIDVIFKCRWFYWCGGRMTELFSILGRSWTLLCGCMNFCKESTEVFPFWKKKWRFGLLHRLNFQREEETEGCSVATRVTQNFATRSNIQSDLGRAPLTAPSENSRFGSPWRQARGYRSCFNTEWFMRSRTAAASRT
jgi:hypothetical protein